MDGSSKMLLEQTNTLKKMLDEGHGYRSENTYGSGVRDLREIIMYEVLELGNSDIVDYCSEIYGIENILNEEVFDTEEEELERWIDNLYTKLNCKKAYGLWLTSIAGVQEVYDECALEEIDQYIIPAESAVLSDLGEDGVLFFYRQRPENFQVD